MRKETKREIDSFTKNVDNAAGFDRLKQKISSDIEEGVDVFHFCANHIVYSDDSY